MLPRWNDAFALFLGSAGILADPAVAAPPPGPCGSLDEAAAALSGLDIARAGRRGRRLSIWIEDAWTRMFPLHWPAEIRDHGAFLAWRAASFEQRFDLAAAQWTIVSPHAWPGRRFLCAAIPEAPLRQLVSQLAARKLGVRAAMPLVMAELRAAIRIRPRVPVLFAGCRQAHRSVLLLKGGRPVDFLALPGSAAPGVLAPALFRERGSSDSAPRWLISHEQPLEQAVPALLGARALPIERVALGEPAARGHGSERPGGIDGATA